MDPLDVLSLTAELSIGFAGFAGIVVTLQNRRDLNRVEAVGLSLILTFALMVMFGSLLPMLLMSVGIEGALLWVVSSWVVIVLLATVIIFSAVSLRGKVLRQIRKKPLMILVWAIPMALIVLNYLNTIGVVFDREFAPYFLTGLWGLGLAAFYFSRMILDPVWRTAREQEAKRRASARVDSGDK